MRPVVVSTSSRQPAFGRPLFNVQAAAITEMDLYAQLQSGTALPPSLESREGPSQHTKPRGNSQAAVMLSPGALSVRNGWWQRQPTEASHAPLPPRAPRQHQRQNQNQNTAMASSTPNAARPTKQQFGGWGADKAKTSPASGPRAGREQLLPWHPHPSFPNSRSTSAHNTPRLHSTPLQRSLQGLPVTTPSQAYQTPIVAPLMPSGRIEPRIVARTPARIADPLMLPNSSQQAHSTQPQMFALPATDQAARDIWSPQTPSGRIEPRVLDHSLVRLAEPVMLPHGSPKPYPTRPSVSDKIGPASSAVSDRFVPVPGQPQDAPRLQLDRSNSWVPGDVLSRSASNVSITVTPLDPAFNEVHRNHDQASGHLIISAADEAISSRGMPAKPPATSTISTRASPNQAARSTPLEPHGPTPARPMKEQQPADTTTRSSSSASTVRAVLEEQEVEATLLGPSDTILAVVSALKRQQQTTIQRSKMPRYAPISPINWKCRWCHASKGLHVHGLCPVRHADSPAARGVLSLGLGQIDYGPRVHDNHSKVEREIENRHPSPPLTPMPRSNKPPPGWSGVRRVQHALSELSTPAAGAHPASSLAGSEAARARDTESQVLGSEEREPVRSRARSIESIHWVDDASPAPPRLTLMVAGTQGASSGPPSGDAECFGPAPGGVQVHKQHGRHGDVGVDKVAPEIAPAVTIQGLQVLDAEAMTETGSRQVSGEEWQQFRESFATRERELKRERKRRRHEAKRLQGSEDKSIQTETDQQPATVVLQAGGEEGKTGEGAACDTDTHGKAAVPSLSVVESAKRVEEDQRLQRRRQQEQQDELKRREVCARACGSACVCVRVRLRANIYMHTRSRRMNSSVDRQKRGPSIRVLRSSKIKRDRRANTESRRPRSRKRGTTRLVLHVWTKTSPAASSNTSPPRCCRRLQTSLAPFQRLSARRRRQVQLLFQRRRAKRKRGARSRRSTRSRRQWSLLAFPHIRLLPSVSKREPHHSGLRRLTHGSKKQEHRRPRRTRESPRSHRRRTSKQSKCRRPLRRRPCRRCRLHVIPDPLPPRPHTR